MSSAAVITTLVILMPVMYAVGHMRGQAVGRRSAHAQFDIVQAFLSHDKEMRTEMAARMAETGSMFEPEEAAETQ